MTMMLQIIPAAVLLATAGLVAGWVWHDWQADILPPSGKAWSLATIAVLLAAAFVCGWAFLSAMTGSTP